LDYDLLTSFWIEREIFPEEPLVGGFSKTMKRIIVLLLVLCLCAGVPSSYAAGKVEDLGTAEKEAVEVLYSLNIIDDSSETFDPSAHITRAQTAKAVYIILKGGQDDGAENFTGTSNTFTDISGHWAEGYINYSFAMGFISGYANRTFMPDEKITGFAFFKIALSVVGYDAKIEGFEGPRWDQHVIGRAIESGILKGYKGKPDDYITARDAVIILYNTLSAPIVEYSSKGELIKTSRTVGEEVFGLRTYKGILWATDEVGLGMPPLARENSSWVDLDGDKEVDRPNEVFSTSADINLLGCHVTVVASVKKNNVEKIYRIFATPGVTNVLQTGKLAEETADDEVTYYYNFEADTDADEDGIMDGYANATNIRYIDNNGDYKCDIVLSFRYKYAKVSSISFDESRMLIEFSIYGSDDKLSLIEFSGLSNVNEGDRIVYFEGNSSMTKGVVRKVNPIWGSITRFDSEYVYFNNKAYLYSQIEGSYETRPGFGVNELHVGKSALLYSFNGEVLEIAPIVESNSDYSYVYVFQIQYVDVRNYLLEGEVYDRAYTAKVVFENGSIDTYRIREVDGVLLPGSTQIDATPPQGLYKCRINSFNQLELITVYQTGMDSSK